MPSTRSSRRNKRGKKQYPFLIFVAYSRSQFTFVHKSEFRDFLKALEYGERVTTWTDQDIDRSDWNDQIQETLKKADMVVCILSQPFLTSRYIRRVELRIATVRHRMEGVAVVPIRYSQCLWEDYPFLRNLQHLPVDGIPLKGRRRLSELLKEIVTNIRGRIRKLRKTAPGVQGLFREPRSLSVLRRLPDGSYSAPERKRLREDSRERATRWVRVSKHRQQICIQARRLLRKNKGRALTKAQLQAIDKKALAPTDRRLDAFRIRWVLRAADLHPQGNNKDDGWRWRKGK